MSIQKLSHYEGKVVSSIEIVQPSPGETGEDFKAVKIYFKNGEWLELKFQANITMQTAMVA